MSFVGKSTLLLSMFFLIGVRFVFAAEYGQIGIRPVQGDPNIPNSNAWFLYTLDPGASKQDRLLLSNTSDTSYTAQVYPVDSVKGSDGGFSLAQFSEKRQGVGSWIRLYPDQAPVALQTLLDSGKTIRESCGHVFDDTETKVVRGKKKVVLTEEDRAKISEWCLGKDSFEVVMAGGSTREIPFVITLPADDIDVGGHTGGIVAQKKAPETMDQPGGATVLLTIRVGARVYVTVSGDIQKNLSFDSISIKKRFSEFFWPGDTAARDQFGWYSVLSTIRNEGNVQTDFDETLTIRDALFGWRPEEVIRDRHFQVLRGDTFLSSIDWKAPRFGRLTFEKEYRYTDASGSEVVKTVTSPALWFWPIREALFSLLFIVSVVSIYGGYRLYQKRRYGGIGWVSYVIQAGDDVRTLSEKCGISWKVLVKTNKLAAPYLLTPQKTILLPPGHDEILPIAHIPSSETTPLEIAVQSADSPSETVALEDQLISEEHAPSETVPLGESRWHKHWLLKGLFGLCGFIVVGVIIWYIVWQRQNHSVIIRNPVMISEEGK